MNFNRAIIGFTLMLLIGTTAPTMGQVQVNGYGNLNLTRTDSESNVDGWYGRKLDYLGGSQIAVNLSYQMDRQISTNIQLLAAGREAFATRVRLAHLNWTPTESLLVRIGKIRLPVFLLSDYQEVGILYPWARLPSELYYVNPFSTMIGVSSHYTLHLVDNMKLIFEAYGGGGEQRFIEEDSEFVGDLQDTLGANINLTGSDFRLRLGAAKADFSGENVSSVLSNSSQPGSFVSTNIVTLSEVQDIQFFALGAKYDNSHWLALGEYTIIDYKNQSKRQPIAESYYLTAGKYFFEKFLAHLTYSRMLPTDFPLFLGSQRTWTVGLNYIYSKDLVLKLDYSNLRAESGNLLPLVTPDPAPGRQIHIGSLAVSFAF